MSFLLISRMRKAFGIAKLHMQSSGKDRGGPVEQIPKGGVIPVLGRTDGLSWSWSDRAQQDIDSQLPEMLQSVLAESIPLLYELAAHQCDFNRVVRARTVSISSSERARQPATMCCVRGSIGSLPKATRSLAPPSV